MFAKTVAPEGVDVTSAGFDCFVDEPAQPCSKRSALMIMIVVLCIAVSNEEALDEFFILFNSFGYFEFFLMLKLSRRVHRRLECLLRP